MRWGAFPAQMILVIRRLLGNIKNFVPFKR